MMADDRIRIDFFGLAKHLARQAAGVPSPEPAYLPNDPSYFTYKERIRRMTLADVYALQGIYEGETR